MKMKLRTTLFASFLGMAAITLIIGLTAFLASNLTLNANKKVIQMSDVEADLLLAISAHQQWKTDLEESFINNHDEISVQFDGHKCGFGTWYYGEGFKELESLSPEAAAIISLVEQSHLNLHDSAERIDDNWEMIHVGLGEELYRRLNDHSSWATALIEDILNDQYSDVEIDHTQCGFGKFLSSDWNYELEQAWPEYRALMEPIKRNHEKLHGAVEDINDTTDGDEKYRIFNLQVTPELESIKEGFLKIIALEQHLLDGQDFAKEIFNTETEQFLGEVSSGINDTIVKLTDEKETLSGDANRLNAIQGLVIWIGIGLGVAIGIIIAFLITRSITRKLGGEPDEISLIADKISDGRLDLTFDDRDEIGVYASMKKMAASLTEIVGTVLGGSAQIASASEELAAGNQDLSNRTEQQASALEETSAAVEEMNSSIKSNADSTRTADQLSREAVSKTEEGSATVEDMVSAMDEINISSNRIADIIEVITNIAFQTNLLALNASIEAARAGEQGKGFAVVAVEVRKLAKRSDTAANEITNIIRNSNEKVSEGVDIANKAGVVLQEVNGAVNKVTALVAEISAASQEQLASADEIDKAINSLDENTQKNAALVEEAASATEELSAQTQELNASMQFFKLSDSIQSDPQIETKTKKKSLMLDTKPSAAVKKQTTTKATKKDESSYQSFSDLVDDGEFDEF